MAEVDHVPPPENHEVGHERSDVNVRAILIFAIGLLIAALVIHLGLYWLLDYYNAREDRRAPAPVALLPSEEVPTAPRLRVAPRMELAKMRAAETKELQTYGWIDKKEKTVRIPIERAMELTAEHGLPARKTAEPKEKR
jgi:hypothetical protein